MPASIRVYIEGDKKLLPGFRQFFNQFYSQGTKIDLAMCGPNVIADFANGVKKFPSAVNILLMDSEGLNGPDLLQKVKTHDKWDLSTNDKVADDCLNFMVQVMESWFLADRQALRNYYGNGLSENRLPANPNIEQIPKADVLHRIESATSNTGKGKYHKTKHAPDLLRNIDPAKVQSASPSCSRLFQYLQAVVTTLTPQGGPP